MTNAQTPPTAPSTSTTMGAHTCSGTTTTTPYLMPMTSALTLRGPSATSLMVTAAAHRRRILMVMV